MLVTILSGCLYNKKRVLQELAEDQPSESTWVVR